MQVAVDAVVFTVRHGELCILLIERKNPPYKGRHALPGGFVKPEESLEDAARRELAEETGVKDLFLLQLGTYGAVRRDPRGRIISVAYLALISPEQELRASDDAVAARWHAADSLPELAFDHANIVEDALRRLRFEIQTTNIAFQILPRRFALSELQKLYEHVLGKTLDKRNFRKRIKELDLLKVTIHTKMEGAHRPARLYAFASPTYSNIREKVNVFLH